MTDISEAENPATNAREQIDTINTVVKFKRGKHVKPSCKKLSDDTLFTDFNTTSEDETTINSERNTVENKTPAEEFINKWKKQHHIIVRNKNKEEEKEMMEKKP